MKVSRKGSELPDRLGVPRWRDGHKMAGGSNIDASSVQVDLLEFRGQFGLRLLGPLDRAHRFLQYREMGSPEEGAPRIGTLPNGIPLRGSPMG